MGGAFGFEKHYSESERNELRARRSIFLAAAVVAVAALVAVGAQAADRGTDVVAETVAAEGSTVSVTPDQLRTVLTPAGDMTPGARITDYTIADANRAGLLRVPSDVVISPTVCTTLVNLSAMNGWVRVGQVANVHTELSMAGIVSGGFDVDRLRANADQCRNGTISMPRLGLTGTISLRPFDATAVEGMRTVGIHQVVSFANHSSDVARQMERMATGAQVYITDSRQIGAVACFPNIEVSIRLSIDIQVRIKALL